MSNFIEGDVYKEKKTESFLLTEKEIFLLSYIGTSKRAVSCQGNAAQRLLWRRNSFTYYNPLLCCLTFVYHSIFLVSALFVFFVVYKMFASQQP